MTALLHTLREQAPPVTPARFLAYHPGCWIQYYDDTEAKNPAKALSTPLFSPAYAAGKQRDRCAVCFSLQAFRDSRSKETITSFRNLGVDVDLIPREDRGTRDAAATDRAKEEYLKRQLLPFPLRPHWVIETQHGFHVIFRVQPQSEAAGIAAGEAVNNLLVQALHGDPCARLLTQVLRVPGFYQFKEPNHPFLCRLLIENVGAIEPYAIEEVRRLLTGGHDGRGDTGAGRSAGYSRVTGKSEPKRWQAGLDGVAAGQRNDTAASLAGKLLAELPPQLWDTAGWGGLKEWNQRNPVPLSENELRAIFSSIAKREHGHRAPNAQKAQGQVEAESRTLRQADQLVSLARSSGTVLFHDEFGEPHAHARMGNARRTYKLRSQEVREWLSQQLWMTERKACNGESLSAALNTLAGIARYEGSCKPLENRVAWHEGALWYDLSDAEGRAVKITADGWDISTDPPIVFRRYNHQRPQVLPVRGQPLGILAPLINLTDPKQCPLLLTYLVTCLLPDIPHPIAVFFGPQGAAKSTATRLFRRLIDPSSLDVLSFADPRQLPQVLFHHYFPCFDNVSAVPEEISDLLCRAVTGEGFSRRRLYSDDEDLIYHFRRCICLNGITLVAEKPDLLERCLLFPLDRIPEGRRQEERQVLATFEGLRPALLGALFDALAGALRRYPSLPAVPLPRMADFARWGCAVADTLGFGADTFLSLYQENIRSQHEAALEADPVALAVAELMTERQQWTGTPSELLLQLQRLVRSCGSQAQVWLPRHPNALTKQLNVLRANLLQAGIEIDTTHRTGSRRRIELRRTIESAPPHDGSDDGDGAVGTAEAARTPGDKPDPAPSSPSRPC